MIATSLWIVRMALSIIVLPQRTSAAMTDPRADILIFGTGNFAAQVEVAASDELGTLVRSFAPNYSATVIPIDSIQVAGSEK